MSFVTLRRKLLRKIKLLKTETYFKIKYTCIKYIKYNTFTQEMLISIVNILGIRIFCLWELRDKIFMGWWRGVHVCKLVEENEL